MSVNEIDVNAVNERTTKRKQLLEFAHSIQLCTQCFSRDSIDNSRMCLKCQDRINTYMKKRHQKIKEALSTNK